MEMREKQATILSKGQEIIRFIATKEVIDRDGDLVIIDGLDTVNFEKNPVFLFMHDMTKPIGKVVNLERAVMEDGIKALIIGVQFHKSDYAQEIKGMYEDGFLNAVSIRFSVKEHANNESGGLNIFKSELYEVSAVTIPSNQEALMLKMMEFSTRLKAQEKQAENVTGLIERIDGLVKLFGAGSSKVDDSSDILSRIMEMPVKK